jgi:hypothetical protein
MDFEVFQGISPDVCQDKGCQGDDFQDRDHPDSACQEPGVDKASERSGQYHHLPSAKAKRAEDLRAEHRHTLALDTEIHFQEQCVNGMFRCRTSNIGLSGAFFSSEHMPLNGKSEVEVVFRAPAQASQKHYRLSATVVRSSNTGAALSFASIDDAQRQDFRRFLLQAKIAARH